MKKITILKKIHEYVKCLLLQKTVEFSEFIVWLNSNYNMDVAKVDIQVRFFCCLKLSQCLKVILVKRFLFFSCLFDHSHQITHVYSYDV